MTGHVAHCGHPPFEKSLTQARGEMMEDMMTMTLALRDLANKWRLTGEKTRLASVEIPNLLARGHMQGLSDGLDIAAADIDKLLVTPGTPEDLE